MLGVERVDPRRKIFGPQVINGSAARCEVAESASVVLRHAAVDVVGVACVVEAVSASQDVDPESQS
jgi:hypothetical protein